MEQTKPPKKNYKSLIALIIFLVIFGLFAVFITSPSTLSKARTSVENCYNVEDVKQCWYKYKEDLHQNDEFITFVKQRLASFDLSENEIQDCKKWLPKSQENLNIIIIPDLSRRIIDTINNPEQITNDTILLDHIWKSFEKAVKLKKNSKDRLIVDVTDNDQAQGKFRTIANELIFDLSTHKNQSNRLYFEKIGPRFSNNIQQLYALGKEQPLGADYWYYFNRTVLKHIRKSTISEDYRNIIVLITDGYLETENHSYTGSSQSLKTICSENKKGKSIEDIFKTKRLQIPPCNLDLSNSEILVIEVNERKSGLKCDFDVLKKYWTNWFMSMKIKNASQNCFIARDNATVLTKEIVDAIVNKK